MNEIEALSASFQDFAETVTARLEAQDKALGRIVIPAASRGGRTGEPRNAPHRAALAASTAGAMIVSAAAGDIEVDVLRSTREALGQFIQAGGDQDALSEFSAASGMSVDNDPRGGYLVSPVLSNTIARKQFDVSPLIRLARKVTIENGDAFEEPVDASDIGASWVSEKDERPETDPAELRMLKVPLNEIYANQPITQRLIDDSQYNVGAYVEDKITDKFARTSGAAFINGNGINKPEGLLHRPTSDQADGDRDFFTIQHLDAAFGNIPDKLVDLVYLLRAPYRQNARWLMNSKTAGVVRKLKDMDGNYIWANGIAAGQPALLLGYPVEIDEEMPDMEVGKSPIVFGDFEKAYIIVDRPGIRMIVDPYTKKPWVLFYAYTRVGGQVQNGEAVKILKMEAL